MLSKTLLKSVVFAFVAAFLLVIPHLLPIFYKQLVIEILIFGLFSLGFDIIYGFTGLLNFGMSVFFGLGGYLVLLPILHWGVGIWTALAICVVACSLFSLVYGYVISRFKSHYSVAFTIVVSMIFFYLAMGQRPYGFRRGAYPQGTAPQFRVFHLKPQRRSHESITSSLPCAVLFSSSYGDFSRRLTAGP